MVQYIDKDALVAAIDIIMKKHMNFHKIACINGHKGESCSSIVYAQLEELRSFINTLKVIDPYEQCIQYPTVKDGIKAHAEVYSFNIESELFNQLTKEQQKLWRKEIEQACISGGDAGYLLARDPRYKENLKVEEVDLEKEIDNIWNPHFNLGWDEKSLLSMNHEGFTTIAKHFFELGLKAQKIQDEIKIGETEIYLEDDGGEPPYDGIQWLDLSCMEYEIPKDKFKDGDNVEIIIRKAQKG